MGGEQGITAIALVTIVATILSVEGQFARLDAGLEAGIRLGDVAEVFYALPADAGKRRVVVSRAEVVEVEELAAVIRVDSEFRVLPGYSVELEIPQRRVAPLGIMELARSRLAASASDADLRVLVDQLIPEDESVEQQVVHLIQERWRRRSAPAGGVTFRNEIELESPAEGPLIAEMVKAVQAWAEAWAEQRADDYLACYSREFRPQGMGRDAWEQLRRQRVSRPQFIKLELVFRQSRAVGESWGWVRFRQSYESNSFSDVVVKRLELVWEDGAWKILRETIEAD